ncbi:hypothetical protein TNCV_404361 [Trichonephila clavipes]|nr:hypothetical protein TNCV_404361 [Trichonephila clavipes]
MCIQPNYGKDILELVQSAENITDADSDNENEMNNVTLVPTSSEIRNAMKSMRTYLDAHSKGERNNKIVDIKQFDAKKRQSKEKYQILFQKLNKCFDVQKT